MSDESDVEDEGPEAGIDLRPAFLHERAHRQTDQGSSRHRSCGLPFVLNSTRRLGFEYKDFNCNDRHGIQCDCTCNISRCFPTNYGRNEWNSERKRPRIACTPNTRRACLRTAVRRVQDDAGQSWYYCYNCRPPVADSRPADQNGHHSPDCGCSCAGCEWFQDHAV